MICVTGAGGTVGSELVRQLVAARAPLRLAYFTAAKAEAARANSHDAVVVDYRKPATVGEAARGCDTLFLLGPSAPEQTQLELAAFEAARSAGVQRVVKLSVFGAAEEAYLLARIHRAVERVIEASGLAFTFLRPNAFMQNVLTFMSASIRAESTLYSAAGDGRIAHVDVRDIAAVGVLALTRPGHEGRAYALTGPEALSYDALARQLSGPLGRTIRHVDVPPEDLAQSLLAAGLPLPSAEVLLDLERFFREDGAAAVTDDVQRVTGREPRRFAAFAAEVAPLLAPV